ncbi:MAG: MFS transporter, partial [Ignavibacteriae bacterium]|nr:MFS transporter [Ignavibacteriota bacterium]
EIQTGNVGIVQVYLSKQPENNEEIVVNISQTSGDNSINLIKGSRFVFNKSNWNKPALILFQIDPKLKSETSATYKAISGNIPLAWSITFGILTAMFLLFFIYHKFMLPFPKSDVSVKQNDTNVFEEFFKTFALFFKKKNIGLIIAFLLLYRLGESQLVKLASPFLLDAREVGGLALTTGEVGFVYGTVGILALVLGGLLGGFLAAKQGLKYWLWWMIIAINLPNAVYIYLSYALPESFITVLTCVAIEQFGYGFGFTAYMLYMIYISAGEHKTAHYAIATAFMALGMMIPGMISGWLQELIGYQHFFIWVVITTIPAFIVAKFIPLDSEFGKEVKES